MILGFSKKFPWGTETDFEAKIKDGRKVHTIRKDERKRWSQGKKIQFATGVRTKNYHKFGELTCQGVQEIVINPSERRIVVDGLILDDERKDELIRLDGFDNHEDFWRWFSEYFRGRLIHWTMKRY